MDRHTGLRSGHQATVTPPLTANVSIAGADTVGEMPLAPDKRFLKPGGHGLSLRREEAKAGSGLGPPLSSRPTAGDQRKQC